MKIRSFHITERRILLAIGMVASIWMLALEYYHDAPVPVPDLPVAAPSAHQSPQNDVRVVRGIDGDTIEVEGGVRVRYIGIDAPESVEPGQAVACFGTEASMKNKELVEGKVVRLERDVRDTDRYGRLLRYVYVGELMINEELVRQGYAVAETYPPDVKYQERLEVAQEYARENQQGLWGVCSGLRIKD